jgi:hypothetical protein
LHLPAQVAAFAEAETLLGNPSLLINIDGEESKETRRTNLIDPGQLVEGRSVFTSPMAASSVA